MATRKNEAKKAQQDMIRAGAKQRRFILRELNKGTRVALIADALGLSTQRIYKVKGELRVANLLTKEPRP